MYFRACRQISCGCCSLGFVLGGILAVLLVLHVMDNYKANKDMAGVTYASVGYFSTLGHFLLSEDFNTTEGQRNTATMTTNKDNLTPYYSYDAIDYTNCYWTGAHYGVFSECKHQYVGVGACASGSRGDCFSNWYTRIYCCQILTTSGNTISNTVTDNGYMYGGYGVNTYCDSNQIINKLCGSGLTADCQGKFHSVMCSTVPSDRTLGFGCYWLWGTWGEDVTCPNQMVINGFCSGGRTKDCKNGAYSHGIYCCDVV